MLTFVGLGLWDERSVTVEGREAIRAADRVFAEFYTSRLMGTSIEDLDSFHETDIEVRDRAGVEIDPGPILLAAETGDAVFLTAGDTMISTTHVDLRLRAHERGMETHVVHAPTAQSAASGLTGLQNYRFGKATTLPFEYAHGGRESRHDSRAHQNASRSGDGDGVPGSVVDTLDANQERDLHSLVYLDIKAERDEYMTADVAAGMLVAEWRDALAVVVARAGSPDPLVAADRLSALANREFGGPLHLLVVPADLHPMEADALRKLAGAPADLLPEE